MRNTKFRGRARETFTPILKVPSQSPLILLAEIFWRQGKDLGSESLDYLHMDFVTSRKELFRGFTAHDQY